MTRERKLAYSHLLYWAMLEIRGLQSFWHGLTRWRLILPSYWRIEQQRVRYAGALAEAMHNMAMFASIDFERFDEARFWDDMKYIDRFQPGASNTYRNMFESFEMGSRSAEMQLGSPSLLAVDSPTKSNS